ncbi:MAG: glycosyltransferase family 4 protein [Polyangiaceae bacterium]
MTRERIAVVTTSYPEHAADPSGHFVQAEVRALESAGANVTVLALRGSAFGWPGAASRLRENPLRAFSAAKEIARVMVAVSRNSSFSRVIAHWAIPCAWPILQKCASVEIVSHGGDVRLLTAMPARMRQLLIGRMLQNTSSWRFVSERLKTDLLGALDDGLRMRLEKIARVQASELSFEVDTGAVDKARIEQRERARGQKVLAVAARLVAGKNVDRAIAYAADENAALLVIGDGPERHRLERLARKLQANAHFLGVLSRAETLAHIAAADALVHMSEAEGLSSVLREAEALGTPVITRP